MLKGLAQQTTTGPYHSLNRNSSKLDHATDSACTRSYRSSRSVKEQITKLYKHTHAICELWMLSTFISNSYTNKYKLTRK
jgi:hypothetical protein